MTLYTVLPQCCVTCLALCCAHCFLDGKHSAHQSRDIDLVYEEVKARVQKKLSAVQTQVMVAKEAIAEVNSAQQELNRCSDDLRANITTGCQRVRAVLDDRMQACVQTITEIKGAKGVSLYEAQKDMEHKRDRLQAGCTAAEKSLAGAMDNEYDFIQDAPQLEADLVMLEVRSSLPWAGRLAASFSAVPAPRILTWCSAARTPTLGAWCVSTPRNGP